MTRRCYPSGLGSVRGADTWTWLTVAIPGHLVEGLIGHEEPNVQMCVMPRWNRHHDERL